MASTRPAVELYSVVSSETQVAVGEVISGAKTSEQALDALIKNIQNY
jgi:ABC-type glycerol-3-phosphate transport system substrate-binding protein